MTEQVLISIKGLQFISTDEEVEPIELITVGNYYHRNGHTFIKFEESFEGVEGSAQNMIKITPNVLEVWKKGVVDVHMVFEREKKNISYYTTPYGTMQMGIAATSLEIQEDHDHIDVHVDYALEINEEYLADCTLVVNVKSKEAKDFALS